MDKLEGIERKLLIKKIQNLNCPKCSKKKERLYGFEINQIISVFIFSNHTRNEQILCLSCGMKTKIRTILITVFAGWWSKRTILLTPKIIVKDIYNFLFIKKLSNQIINNLINEKSGYFKRKGIDEESLNVLLKSRNVKHIAQSK